MIAVPASRLLPAAGLTAGVALLAALGGLGFALWSRNGAEMFAALVQSGLALCF